MHHLQRYQKCPVCGSPSFSVLESGEELAAERVECENLFRRALPDTPDELLNDITVFTNAYDAQLVVCRNCGLVSRDPRFSAQGSIQAYARDNYTCEWLENAFIDYRSAFQARMPELVQRIGRSARVLEIGSYAGGFLAAAGDFGWQAQGVDVGASVSEFARGKGLDVFTGTLADADLATAAGSFDAVFAWVCFDQLPDAPAELERIRNLLKRGGWLWIQVPNGDFIKRVRDILCLFPSLQMRERARNVLALTGLCGFPFQIGYTPATLRRLLSAGGFTRIKIRNRTNVADRSRRQVQAESHERAQDVRWAERASDLVYQLSLHRVATAPWIEVNCRKP